MGKQFAHRLFVGDWTFGRIVALDVANDDKSPVDFLLSKGQFGFAVTDLVIGADGLLYVTVGGRGTEGGLFRIEPSDAVLDSDDSNFLAPVADRKARMRKRRVLNDSPRSTFGEIIRSEQLRLGGCGGCDGMMAGYTAKHSQPKHPKAKGNSAVAKRAQEIIARAWEQSFNTLLSLRNASLSWRDASEREIDELFRLYAMHRIKSEKWSGRVFSTFAAEKDPVRGIHLLNCYSVIAQSTHESCTVGFRWLIKQYVYRRRQQLLGAIDNRSEKAAGTRVPREQSHMPCRNFIRVLSTPRKDYIGNFVFIGIIHAFLWRLDQSFGEVERISRAQR